MPSPNATAPLLSVVLCARDAAGPLGLRLEGLCRQTLPREAFEVVVVDDGSRDATFEVARAFKGRLPLRATRQRPAGIASARNHGLFCARGVVVLFLDAGVPEPGHLEAHLEAHRRFPELRFAAVGESRTAPDLAEDPLLRFLEEATDLEWRRGPAPEGEVAGFAHLDAGRASLKRRFLLERGVFHHAFRCAGEDVDLAFRLARHGLAVVRARGAIARRVEPTSVEAVRARLEEVGAAAVLLARRHDDPELRAVADAAGSAAAWRELAPLDAAMLRSARELDRFVRLRREEGLEVDGHDLALLHRSYRAAFAASRARGAAEAERRLAAPARPRAP